MKNIIVPIDFSEGSMKGLDLAVLFANQTKATINMVYVQKQKIESFFSKPKKREYQEAHRLFEELIEEYEDKIEEDVEMVYKVRKGKIHEKVIEQAKAFPDPYIITSTWGSSGFENLFIGSNAYKIITASDDIPVISTRRGKTPDSIDTIVLPIDASEETRQKVPRTIEIAQIFNSKIHILEVSTTDRDSVIKKIEAYTAQVQKKLKDFNIQHTIEQRQNDNTTDAILEYAEKVDADLITMMTEQQRSRLGNILLGSYAHQLVNQTAIPVLSISPQDLNLPHERRTDAYNL